VVEVEVEEVEVEVVEVEEVEVVDVVVVVVVVQHIEMNVLAQLGQGQLTRVPPLEQGIWPVGQGHWSIPHC